MSDGRLAPSAATARTRVEFGRVVGVRAWPGEEEEGWITREEQLKWRDNEVSSILKINAGG